MLTFRFGTHHFSGISPLGSNIQTHAARPQVARAFSLTVILLGAILAALGGIILYTEAAIFLKSGGGRNERLSPLVSGTYATGLSGFSNRILMLDCDEALNSTFGKLQPADTRVAYAQNCLQAADDVLKRRPSDGLAHLVKANAYQYLGDNQAMARSLVLSQHMSPGEGWIADGRLRLGLPIYPDLPADAAAAVAADVALLASSRRSAAWLARLYLRKDKSPEVLLSLVDILPDGSKANVLAEIRAATRLR